MLQKLSVAAACACAIAVGFISSLDVGAAPRANKGIKGDETGFASMHEWRRVGGRTCFTDHTHDGSGSGPNRRQAEIAAIRSWQDFTSLEYGNAWASYGIAAAKVMRCDGSGATWSCSTEALPCRGSALPTKPSNKIALGRAALQARQN